MSDRLNLENIDLRQKEILMITTDTTIGVVNIISNVWPDTDDPSSKRQRTEDVIFFFENNIKEI